MGKPQGKRPLGRPRRIGEDNINVDRKKVAYFFPNLCTNLPNNTPTEPESRSCHRQRAFGNSELRTIPHWASVAGVNFVRKTEPLQQQRVHATAVSFRR